MSTGMKLWWVEHHYRANEFSGQEVEVTKTGSKYHYFTSNGENLKAEIETGRCFSASIIGLLRGKCWRNQAQFVAQTRLGVVWEQIGGAVWNKPVPPHLTYEDVLRIARDLHVEIKM